MKKIITLLLIIAVSIITFSSSCRAEEKKQTEVVRYFLNDKKQIIQKNGDTENVSYNAALTFVRNLETGINIGNTLDSIGTNTWFAGETGWGNPKITREFIKALKNYGYKTIRLPVTWAEYMGPAPNYTIAEERMSRAEEVVKWILAEDMYCIINLHHDGGEADKSWILQAASEPDKVAGQFAKVWTQIAARFSGVSQEKLIFESMNEVGFDKLWNRYGGSSGGKAEAYRIFNLLNQTFVDTVRRTAGNQDRFLLIAGYWTDIELSCDSLFKMPDDTKEDKLILSIHYYTPAVFCIAEERNNSWGFRDDWGNNNDINELNRNLQKLKVNFIDKGIPVIMGEYGVAMKNKVEEGRIKWMTAVTQACLDNGICPVLWDTGGEISRHPPYTMRNSLAQARARLKM